MQPPSIESHSSDQNNRNTSTRRNSNSNVVAESLASSSSNNAFTANLFKPTATHFYLRRKRTATTYIPESAERTKRLYPELQADQDFLHQMLGIWSSKLEQLKMDEQILERMARIPKSKLRGVPTLFSQPDDTQTFDTTIIDALSHEQSNTGENQVELEDQELQEHADMNNDDHYHDDDKYIGSDQNESASSREEKPIDKQDDNDSSEDEELLQQWNIQSEVEDNDEEDEEATRRALTFMLAEFGDQLE